jgi:hypothetical protein
MATTSIRSIRIRGIDKAVSLSDFNSICAQWCEVSEDAEKGLLHSLSPWIVPSTRLAPGSSAINFQSSLALQDDYNTATVTFESVNVKAAARRALLNTLPNGWKVDDVFDGLTILYSPEPADSIEIE